MPVLANGVHNVPTTSLAGSFSGYDFCHFAINHVFERLRWEFSKSKEDRCSDHNGTQWVSEILPELLWFQFKQYNYKKSRHVQNIRNHITHSHFAISKWWILWLTTQKPSDPISFLCVSQVNKTQNRKNLLPGSLFIFNSSCHWVICLYCYDFIQHQSHNDLALA